MTVLLQYGDALKLLDELDKKFGQRDINPNTNGTIEVKVPLKCGQLKKGHPVTQTTVLTFDEADTEFEERMAKKQELLSHGADIYNAFIKRRVTHHLKVKPKVSPLIDDLRKKIKLHEYDTGGLLTPADYAVLIIDLLKYGSNSDECFFCDEVIASPSLFYHGLGYQGDKTINALLEAYELKGYKKRPLATVLQEIRDNVGHNKEHETLRQLITSFNRHPITTPIDILTASAEEITQQLGKAGLLNHYYGAYIDTDEPTTSIDDFPPLSQDYLETLESKSFSTLRERQAEAQRNASSLFSKIFK